MSVPIGEVPGEVPVPVRFTMNGTFMSTLLGFVTPAPDTGLSFWWNLGIHGLVGFGQVTWRNGYQKAEPRTFILEDGRAYSEGDFKDLSQDSRFGTYGAGLPAVYGLSGLTGPLLVSHDGKLAWIRVSCDQIPNDLVKRLAPRPPEGFMQNGRLDVILDKDRLRVYVEIEEAGSSAWRAKYPRLPNRTGGVGLPVLWEDPWGHQVTFAWSRSSRSCPDGDGSLVRVEALNARGRGVILRYLAGRDEDVETDLLRGDFVDCAGPSFLVRGYPGAAMDLPEGAVLDPGGVKLGVFLPAWGAGLVGRPTLISMGRPERLAQPSWSDAGDPVAAPPPSRQEGPDVETREWRFSYDPNRATLLALQDPLDRLSTFSFGTPQALYPGGRGAPAWVWGVTDVVDRDLKVPTSGFEFHWRRELPRSEGGHWIQPEWKVVHEEGRMGETPARTTIYRFAPPGRSRLDYGNGFLDSVTVVDGAGEAVTAYESTTREDRGAGLDGSLSRVRSVTTVRPGEHPKKETFVFVDDTALQIQQVNHQADGGSGFTTHQYDTTRFDDEWRRLDGGQVARFEAVRYSHGRPQDPPLVLENDWVPGQGVRVATWNRAGTLRHGTIYSHDGEGRVRTEDVYHRDGDTWAESPRHLDVGYDDGNGCANRWTTRIQVGAGNWETLERRATGFDAGDRATALVDENGIRTRLAFDLFGREVLRAEEGSLPVTTTYPDARTLVRIQGPRVTRTHLDAFGRVLRVERPDGTRERCIQDALGRPCTWIMEGPDESLAFRILSLDGFDRPVYERRWDGVETRTTYARADLGYDLVTRTRQGAVERRYLDPHGQAVHVQDPGGRALLREFDGQGRLRTLEMVAPDGASSQSRTFRYDALGRLLHREDPERGTWEARAFDALNNPTDVIESGSRIRRQAFDGLGRLRSRSAVWLGDRAEETFRYEGNRLIGTSRILSGSSASRVTQTLAYGPDGRIAGETTWVGGRASNVRYTYSRLGELETVTYPSGRIVTYGFDGIGRPVSVSSSLGNAHQVLVPVPSGSPFDVLGNRQSVSYSSGVTEEWVHDPWKARLEVHRLTPKGGPPVEWRFSYDAEGRLVGTGEWSIRLDALGRMVSADQAWDIGPGGVPQRIRMQTGFDAFDNLMTRTYFGSHAPGAELNTFAMGGPLVDNRLPATTGSRTHWDGGWISAIHDPFGALESFATAVSSPRSLDMAWDPLGGLRRVDRKPGGPGLVFHQNAQGLKVGEVREAGEATSEQILTYEEGTRLLSIEERTTGAFKDLIYLDGRLVAEGWGETLVFCHLDHLGTPRLLTDQDGKVVGRQDLGPFGEILKQSGVMPVLGFGGHRPLAGLELMDMKCRIYSVSWSRFIEPDRVDDAKQWSLYGFCAGNPLSLVDQDGQAIQLAWLFSSLCYLNLLECLPDHENRSQSQTTYHLSPAQADALRLMLADERKYGTSGMALRQAYFPNVLDRDVFGDLTRGNSILFADPNGLKPTMTSMGPMDLDWFITVNAMASTRVFGLVEYAVMKTIWNGINFDWETPFTGDVGEGNAMRAYRSGASLASLFPEFR